MSIQLVDVSSWRRDDEHGIFPIGARDKKMLWSHPENIDGIKSNWPYLFKLSRDAYPDQFWMEIIAYIVGEAMGLEVPKALPAVRVTESESQEYGALLEWFYDKNTDIFIHASDFFHVINKTFDNEKGGHHNFRDLKFICRTLNIHDFLITDWSQWTCDMLLFDSLIGNSDRHQENWGFVFTSQRKDDTHLTDLESKPVRVIKLSPYFDNGTSLGHERFPEKVSSWNEGQVDSYIEKGNHHLRLDRSDTKTRLGHIQSIQGLSRDPVMLSKMNNRLKFDINEVCRKIISLTQIDANEGSLSRDRASWVIRLLKRRYKRLRLITNMRIINHIVEPERLWLTWQPSGGGARYVVGYLDRDDANSVTFTYSNDTEDFNKALEKGFKGYPAFQMKQKVHTGNVLEPFLRRLPPRKRKDFDQYLTQHFLPVDFTGSDFALLGYTGAKSPADGFCLVNDSSVFEKSCELLLEVVGTRYQSGLNLLAINVGDSVTLLPETDNQYDPDAVAVIHDSGKIGYINKVHCKTVKSCINSKKISAFIAKKNGTVERPLVYLFVECH